MLRTGDILLFKENRTLVDFFLRWATGSKWTHVAVAIIDPPGFPKGEYVLEAGSEPTRDLLSAKRIYGTQLQFLKNVVDKQTFVRKLVPPLDSEQIGRLWDLCKEMDASPYDTHISDWLLALERQHGDQRAWAQHSDKFWCSALAAYLYTKLGLLPEDTPWTLIAPSEWADPTVATLGLQGHVLGALEPVGPCIAGYGLMSD